MGNELCNQNVKVVDNHHNEIYNNGKQVDDGYRAIHLYYQRDSHSYPIEVQLWCGDDYLFNIWSHKWIYKYLDPVLGRALYYEYKNSKMKTEDDFILKLNEMRE